MSSILLYHHLGLGDNIICNAMVREYCNNYTRVAIFSKPQNYQSVTFMFRDLKNLVVIKGDDAFARKFILLNKFKVWKFRYDDIKIIGFQNLDRNSGVHFDEQFYKIAGIDFNKKWDTFFVKRDYEREEAFFKKNLLPNDYAFVHEDTKRGFVINHKFISSGLPIFVPERTLTENIFDYCTIIERAKEIHVFDSSFMSLIDCLKYDNPGQKLYMHRYAKFYFEWSLPTLKKKWEVLIKPE